jgi:hypothetical protein
MVYESARTFQYPKPKDRAIADLREGMSKIGVVDRVSELTSTVFGHCRIRKPWPMTVQLRAAVFGGPEADSVVVQLNAYGSDIWEYGARRGLGTVEEVLEGLRAASGLRTPTS